MDGVSGVGSRVHLTPDDDESTRSIVERDGWNHADHVSIRV
jgi:hypothetical protein